MIQTPVIAHGPWWRGVRALLVVVSRASLLVIAAMLLFPDAWPWVVPDFGNPLRLARAFATFSLAPGVTAWLIGRVFAGRLSVEDGTLVVERLDKRVEIPCTAIRRLAPWTLPLPAGGVSLQLASGRWFPWGLQIADPVALGEGLAEAGASDDLRREARTPAAVYARSTTSARHWTDHPAFKLVLFALVPTLPVFRLHQWVAYGGTFGEYYMYGLRAYLLAFAIYWVWSIVQLVLFAAILRTALEPIVIVTAWTAPARTPAARRVVEAAHRLLFYGGVVAFLGRLYLQSLGS